MRLPREEWTALIRDAHEGYITWEDYEQNLGRLRDNAQACGADRKSAPREGPALLQGLVICGVCGQRMTVRYHAHHERRVPDYMCQKRGIERAEPFCQQVHGAALDEAIGQLLVELVSPVTLEVSLAVHEELSRRAAEADHLRHQEVEQARYEADRARHRYMQVDPDNRLVADALEAEWNAKLRTLEDAQQRYEQRRAAARTALDEQHRAKIMALATDFARLWSDPNTADRERKRMARLLIEDVTLLKADALTAHVRFKGGATRTLSITLPKPAWLVRKTSEEVIAEVDRLLDEYTDGAIADILNQRGLRSGVGKVFHLTMVTRIRTSRGLKSRYDRLRARGLLTLAEIAAHLDIDPDTVKVWRRAGLLKGHRWDDRGQCLFEPPGPNSPLRYKRKGVWKGRSRPQFCSQPNAGGAV